MCGIVGLYLKNKQMEASLGELFAPMLAAMSDRGPDSAGFAIYGDTANNDEIKVSFRHETKNYAWDALAKALENESAQHVSYRVIDHVAIFKLKMKEEDLLAFLKGYDSEIIILSAGESIEIYKAAGEPDDIIKRFELTSFSGSHIIGHTRMATESAVTMAGSHPFSTGQDLCLVHNGSLSNHNRLRLRLESVGIDFATENDSEVAAGYLMWRLQEGDDLHAALNSALKDLDGFYTFAIGTKDGFAVLRDPIACKPAVMAETEDYVAMASEYRALSSLPNIENAKVWEPEPATIYVWEK